MKHAAPGRGVEVVVVGKVKATLSLLRHIMGRRGIMPLIPNPDTRWKRDIISWLLYACRKSAQVPGTH
jgi:hypothetical protein